MGTKSNPGKHDCYNNALPDEPMFVLLGRDPDAPRLIREWVEERRNMISAKQRPIADLNMCAEASQLADDMEKWRRENDGKWRK